MKISQGTIKTWSECPLKVKYKLDAVPRTVSSAMSFGNALHLAVMDMEVAGRLQVGLNRLNAVWDDLDLHGLSYDYMMPRMTHDGYRQLGETILTDWWQLIQWDTDIVLAREHEFLVPIGENTLHGFVDKLVIRRVKGGEDVLVVSDYKTGSKLPTREYLRHDVQFSAYAYATTQPEFWDGLPNGQKLWSDLQPARRFGEWVHMRPTRRVDCGERTAMHYNRVRYACDAIAESIAMGIFPPTISGAACEFCDFRKLCGLPLIEEEAA